jgi:alpha-D-ribose 1-methylphosphonate 5-phosphate C-P lyase
MSKLIVEDEDFSSAIPNLTFNCGICNSDNTFIDFYYLDGNGGQMKFICNDCESYIMPGFYEKEWSKQSV